MRYLVTHGLRHGGINPSHTIAGYDQIGNLALPETGVAKVVVGTGIRFQEIYDILKACGQLTGNEPRAYSPFCGSADGLDPPDQVILANGMHCLLGRDYIGLADTQAFDAWKFVAEQPEGTLFCAGGELMTALTGNKGEKGRLYVLDVEAKTANLL